MGFNRKIRGKMVLNSKRGNIQTPPTVVDIRGFLYQDLQSKIATGRFFYFWAGHFFRQKSVEHDNLIVKIVLVNRFRCTLATFFASPTYIANHHREFLKIHRGRAENIYNGICLVGRLSNRTILPKICLTGQFFLGVCLTGQLKIS